MAAGFTINADDALRLATDIARKRAALLPKIHGATLTAGRQIQALARSGAPKGPHTRGYNSSFWTKTTKSETGTTVAIESKNKLGTILVYGTPTSGPHDSPGAALERVLPSWERAIADAAAEVI